MQLKLFHEKKFLGGRHRGRKVARVFSSKQAMHFTLKAKRYVQHESRLLSSELTRLAERFEIRVYEHAVNRDHLHVKLRAKTRNAYRAFIRSFTGLLARKMGKGLWKELPYGRLVAWGSDFIRTAEYIVVNQLEALGLVRRRDRIPYWRRSGERVDFSRDWAVYFRG